MFFSELYVVAVLAATVSHTLWEVVPVWDPLLHMGFVEVDSTCA